MKTNVKRILSILLAVAMVLTLLGNTAGKASAASAPHRWYTCLGSPDTVFGCVKNTTDECTRKITLTKGDQLPINGWVLSNIAISSYTIEYTYKGNLKKTQDISIDNLGTFDIVNSKSNRDMYEYCNAELKAELGPNASYSRTKAWWSAVINTSDMPAGDWIVDVKAKRSGDGMTFGVAKIRLTISNTPPMNRLDVPQENTATMVFHGSTITTATLEEIVNKPAAGYHRVWYNMATNKEFTGTITVLTDMQFRFEDKPNARKIQFIVDGKTVETKVLHTNDCINNIASTPTKSGFVFVGWSPSNSFNDIYMGSHKCFFSTNNAATQKYYAMFIPVGESLSVDYKMNRSDADFLCNQLYDYLVKESAAQIKAEEETQESKSVDNILGGFVVAVVAGAISGSKYAGEHGAAFGGMVGGAGYIGGLVFSSSDTSRLENLKALDARIKAERGQLQKTLRTWGNATEKIVTFDMTSLYESYSLWTY